MVVSMSGCSYIIGVIRWLWGMSICRVLNMRVGTERSIDIGCSGYVHGGDFIGRRVLIVRLVKG